MNRTNSSRGSCLIAAIGILGFFLSSCSSATQNPLCGKWVCASQAGSPGSFLVFSKNGKFKLGDINDGKEVLGVSGTWQADKTAVTLKITNRKCCKIQKGEVFNWPYKLKDDLHMEVADPGSQEGPRLFERKSSKQDLQ